MDPVQFYKRMFIIGAQNQTFTADVQWYNQSADGFRYLRVSPIRTTTGDYPTPDGILSSPTVDPIDNPEGVSTCNLYDFRLVIYNDLDRGATVHFHGLTPPSNEDGVPFVASANIHEKNPQYYRFHQLTYPGMHWMHAHTGFQEAYGVSAPIILDHSNYYHEKNNFRKEDDLVVILEEGFVYPKCAYSARFWYHNECIEGGRIPSSKFGKLACFINRREGILENTPVEGTEYMRIRFLNAGSEAPWRITNKYSERYGGANITMEILSTDGNDVVQNVTRREFVLGLANRIDVLIPVNSTHDTVITAIQMMHRGDVTNPVLRHILIRGSNNENTKIKSEELPVVANGAISPILEDFNLIRELNASHPLVEREPTRIYTVFNKGGDQFGGFPLSLYDGLKTRTDDNDGVRVRNSSQVNSYTELNHLKFQLPPYKTYRNKISGDSISTRRNCTDCTQGEYNGSGIRNRTEEDQISPSFLTSTGARSVRSVMMR